MSYIEYKKIKKNIVDLATQKFFGLLLAKSLDRLLAYGIIKLPI